jgi:hypothetical protein
MKLISYDKANVIIQLPLDDVKPLETYSPPAVINQIRERYKLTVPRMTVPNSSFPAPVMAAMGMAFQQSTFVSGKFSLGDTETIIRSLQVVPDLSAFILTMGNTDEGDLVADDLLYFLDESCHFRGAKEKATRVYGSSVIIEFDRDFGEYIDAIGRIQNLITRSLGESLKIDREVRLERISFGYDPAQLPSGKAFGNFGIERRQGHPYSANRYFCGAALRTKEHISLLEMIECTLAE